MTSLPASSVAPAALPKANDPCWCGSGRKYKRCHKKSEGRVLPGEVTPMRSVPPQINRPPYADTGEFVPYDEPRIKSPETIAKMRASGALAAEVLAKAGELVAPGVTTESIDLQIHEWFIERNAYPSTINYHGYPKASCTSVNEVICHGIPDSRPLQDGDICNLDVPGYHQGVHGDTNATFFVGDVDPESQQLVRVTEAAAMAGSRFMGRGDKEGADGAAPPSGDPRLEPVPAGPLHLADAVTRLPSQPSDARITIAVVVGVVCQG